MKFDIKTNPHHTTWDLLLATWRRADEAESIEGAWVFDHFYPIFGDLNGPCLEGWTTLAALAQATSRIQVGTMVNGMPYRHPAVTANMASTMDIISNGRFQLGLGAGWNQMEADAYGISLGETIRKRMDMFDEGVEIIVKLLTQEESDFEGEHFTLTKARNEPKGPQQPHPPIVIGGGGEKRTLRTVARWADHWNLTPNTVEEWSRKKQILAGHCADIGRDPDEIMSSLLIRFNPSDPEALIRDVDALEQAGADKAIINFPAQLDPGHVDVAVEALERLG
jgi:F420-dependent oxidoreductase-like protein